MYINVTKHIALKGDKETGLIEFNEKELIPDAMLRRKLTRSSKIFIYMQKLIETYKTPIILGSNLGEINVTCKILNAIINNKRIMPLDFQNSVHNTPQTYSTILHNNKSEVCTVSCGSNTSFAALKCGYIKLLANDDLESIIVVSINTYDDDLDNLFYNVPNKHLESAVIMLLSADTEPIGKCIDVNNYISDSNMDIEDSTRIMYSLSVDNNNEGFCIKYV